MFLLSAIFVTAAGAEYTKNYRKGWAKSSVSALKISNKFGEVKINDLGGDSVTIKVEIRVEGQSEAKARELINLIEIDFQKNGSVASAETNIRDNFRSKQSFSINYLVNIPKDKDLDVTNRYGNLIINDLEAKGNLNVSYGSLTAGNMKAPAGNPLKIAVSYGKADIESMNDATLEFNYSKLYAGNVDGLVLVSKYSTANFNRIRNLNLDSKYDAINIEEVGHLKSLSKYTNYKVGLLTGSFDLDTGYGSVRIAKVDPKFERIKIVNSYGGITIGLGELSYKLKADCSYCEVNYPGDRYKGNRIKENTRFTLDGQVGTGGGSVDISSRFG
jgi:hypothetical protein